MPATTDIHIRLNAEQTAKLDRLRLSERTRPSRNAFVAAIVRDSLTQMTPPMDGHGPGPRKAGEK